MTSPMFSYPQPTDAELSAQQQPPHPDESADRSTLVYQRTPELPHPSAAVRRSSDTTWLGQAALIIGIGATALSLTASIILGGTVSAMDLSYGDVLSGPSDWFSDSTIFLLCLQGVCTILGLAGFVMGMFAVATRKGRTQGVIATIIAILAPVVSVGVFVITALTSVSLIP